MKYYEADKLTLKQVQEMIRNGDDAHHNQIRITENGYVFLSRLVGNEELAGIKIRFETFCAGNNCVGLDASLDNNWVRRIFKAIIKWKDSTEEYIDIM